MATKPWGGRSPCPNVAHSLAILGSGAGTEVPQWGGARKINFNAAPPSAMSRSEEKNPKHHPKFPLCTEGRWSPREVSRRARQEISLRIISLSWMDLRVNGPHPRCSDGKSDPPASPHGVFVRIKDALKWMQPDTGAHGRGGGWILAQRPLGRTTCKTMHGALTETWPTLFLIIHLTKRLS